MAFENKNQQITRRDFLKLVSLIPIMKYSWDSMIDAGRMSISGDEPTYPNFIVLVLDALSAKHMSLYGYQRGTTPNIDRFAERATVFHNHFSAGNFTTPGTASLLTGTYPWTHRGLHYFGTVFDQFATNNIFSMLPEQFHTIAYTHNFLAKILLMQFYDDIDEVILPSELGIASDIVSEKYISKDFFVNYCSEQLIRHFDEVPLSLFFSILDVGRQGSIAPVLDQYSDLFPRGVPYTSGNRFHFIMEHAIDWLKIRIAELSNPYFIYYHLFPPHEPYNTRHDFIDMFNDEIQPLDKPEHFFTQNNSTKTLINERQYYDEYLAYADAEFGRLYDFLIRSGSLENTYLILTSDHGQMFERGIHGHGTPTIYDPIIRVPLILSKPGQTTREDVNTSTSCVDLLPTLLSIVGKQIPEWCEGSILPTFKDSEEIVDRNIYTLEAKSNSKWGSLTIGTAGLLKDKYKLIHYFGYEGYKNVYELYDLDKDPQELVNLYSSRNSIAESMKNELLLKLKQVNSRNQ
jgi:arylsulfatase A-like enzyme